MRPAPLFLVLLLGLCGAAAPSLAATPGRAASAAPAPAQRTPLPQPAEENGEGGQVAQRSDNGQTGARPGERRRRSYASCNRDSHKRNLRGGARRRFLIRCKLGYERRQPAHPAEPAPGRRS